MIKNKISINIISSFNHVNFVGILRNSRDFDWQINEVDYNQVFQTLKDPSAKVWKKRTNITLVWTTPESISPEFQKLQNGNVINSNLIKDEIKYFCSSLKSIKG